jgi:DNA-binding MarR family transcriptional regulator
MSARAPKSETNAAKLRLRLWLRLLKASKAVEIELRDRLRREFDTTLPRFDVMAMLARKGEGLKMSELSEALMVSNGNVTGIVDRLVAEGLVVRVSIAGDRRATLVRLTPKGDASFSAMAAAHEGWIGELLGSLGDDDARAAISILDKVRKT